MNKFVFTKLALRQFQKLTQEQQNRITEKLVDLKTHPDIYVVIHHLTDFEDATHRIRVGDYRVFINLLETTDAEKTFAVLYVKRRDEAYT